MNANEMNHNPLSRTTNESFECNRSPETLPRSMFSPSVAILTKRESFNNGNSKNIQNLRRRRADVLQIKNIRRLPTATTATLMHATMSKAIVSSRTTVGTIAKCTKFHQNRDSLIVGLILFAVCLSASVADASSKSNQNSQNTENIVSIYPKHDIIHPILIDGKNERELLRSTRKTNGQHAEHIILKYTHLDRVIVADLFLNSRLLADDHFLSYQNANGSRTVRRFSKSDADLCHYHGQIRDNRESRVALSTCDGLNGFVYDGRNTFFIQPKEGKTLDNQHVILNQKHISGIDDFTMSLIHTNATGNVRHRIRQRRSPTDNKVIEPFNSNEMSSYVELVMVADNGVYKDKNSDLNKVHRYCKDIANIINALYNPLNIFVALVGVVVWTEKDEIELSNDGDKTLKNFLAYRRKTLVKDHPNDNAQLLTKETFDGGVVGKALKGPICTYEFSGGVSMDHSSLISVVATTIAHEMGHNFGMEHDSPDCKCIDERCIMSAASSSIAPVHWSECSIDQLNYAIHQGMNYCLKNIPKTLFEPPTCGNGFVEAGEECDCGLPNFCKNSCCDPHTCKLRSNATCAAGKCCDLTTCRPHFAGTKCRPESGECDLPEYCNGESEFCPTDYFKRNAESCNDGKAYCYNGICRTRDDQCKLLWGPSGKSSEQCYEKNLEGNRHGNCGYDRLANTYRNCSMENIYCGLLQCRHLNERLEFGMESVAVLSHSFISHNGSIIPCRTAIVDLGIDSVDPGMTPDGSKCGDGKMCLKQKCTVVETLKASGEFRECSENCNGHGTCDNIGKCHCELGFAPPLCDGPGPGGSEHSGPASDPDDGYGFTRVLFVFFLGVVPFISIVLLLMYYWKQNRSWFIMPRPTTNEIKVLHRHDTERGNPPSSFTHTRQLSPSSTDDMNATLLKTSNHPPDNNTLKNDIFGNFKGFSLKPLPMSKPSIANGANVAYVHPVAKTGQQIDANSIPTRSAPPPPASPVKQTANFQSASNATKSSTLPNAYNKPGSLPIAHTQSPKLFAMFPLKDESKERPKISSPILENSTCTVKELVTPKREQNPVPSTTAILNQKTLLNNATKPQLTSSPKSVESVVNRSESFTKPTKGENKNLKKTDISAPIKSVNFGRSQSMRTPAAELLTGKRSALASGSMRHPAGAKRPISIVDRPKNPPPPRPPLVTTAARSDYDDCESTDAKLDSSTDNIYCELEEYRSPKATVEASPLSHGLLSEIVNEIENRQLDSIYATSKKSTSAPTTNGATNGGEEIYQNLKTAEKNAASNLTVNRAAPSLPKPNEPKKNSYANLATIGAEKKPTITAAKPKTSALTKSNSTVTAHTTQIGQKPKPTIASKPVTLSKSTAGDNKANASSEKSSQVAEIKRTLSRSGATNSLRKPNITPSANVKSLHRKFESAAAANTNTQSKK